MNSNTVVHKEKSRNAESSLHSAVPEEVPNSISFEVADEFDRHTKVNSDVKSCGITEI